MCLSHFDLHTSVSVCTIWLNDFFISCLEEHLKPKHTSTVFKLGKTRFSKLFTQYSLPNLNLTATNFLHYGIHGMKLNSTIWLCILEFEVCIRVSVLAIVQKQNPGSLSLSLLHFTFENTSCSCDSDTFHSVKTWESGMLISLSDFLLRHPPYIYTTQKHKVSLSTKTFW